MSSSGDLLLVCLSRYTFPCSLQYRARLSRNAAFRASSNKEKSRRQKEAETTLRRVLAMDPTDGRPYVALGKLLLQQKRVEEARKLYDDGSAATGSCVYHNTYLGRLQHQVVLSTVAPLH